MPAYTTPQIRVSINNQSRQTVRTVGISALASTGKLAGLVDVDASSPNENETLVYDAETQKYIVRTLPMIDGGSY